MKKFLSVLYRISAYIIFATSSIGIAYSTILIDTLFSKENMKHRLNELGESLASMNRKVQSKECAELAYNIYDGYGLSDIIEVVYILVSSVIIALLHLVFSIILIVVRKIVWLLIDVPAKQINEKISSKKLDKRSKEKDDTHSIGYVYHIPDDIMDICLDTAHVPGYPFTFESQKEFDEFCDLVQENVLDSQSDCFTLFDLFGMYAIEKGGFLLEEADNELTKLGYLHYGWIIDPENRSIDIRSNSPVNLIFNNDEAQKDDVELVDDEDTVVSSSTELEDCSSKSNIEKEEHSDDE